MTAATTVSEVRAYAAMCPGAALEPYRFSHRDLAATDIEIAITHCGICHSDWHLIQNDWGVSSYPLVPGHEIVGTIARLGAEITALRQGQRVGVGWLAGACMRCEQCRAGTENLCRQAQPTCVGRPGGYAAAVIVDGRFAASIPHQMPSEVAAPLLCAGITVFAPLRRRQLAPCSRVGIVGVGGLSHLAIQFAKGMGCAVTAFSETAGKAKDAAHLGADRFVWLGSEAELKAEASTSDFVLATPPVDLPWAAYLEVLKPDGRFCIVGAAPGDVRLPACALIGGQKSIGGSAVGSNAEIRAMLDFAVAHHLQRMVELYAMNDVNKALERLIRNQIRYRAVLVHHG
jgi:uncharacterized zinc-type alcohol dehydrogenase-like protein